MFFQYLVAASRIFTLMDRARSIDAVRTGSKEDSDVFSTNPLICFTSFSSVWIGSDLEGILMRWSESNSFNVTYELSYVLIKDRSSCLA